MRDQRKSREEDNASRDRELDDCRSARGEKSGTNSQQSPAILLSDSLHSSRDVRGTPGAGGGGGGAAPGFPFSGSSHAFLISLSLRGWSLDRAVFLLLPFYFAPSLLSPILSCVTICIASLVFVLYFSIGSTYFSLSYSLFSRCSLPCHYHSHCSPTFINGYGYANLSGLARGRKNRARLCTQPVPR